MDPVTAIGLAAAVIQFISFSKDVFQLCKEIRDSDTSATKHNQELEAALRIIRDARELMISPDAARASIVSADATNEPTSLSNDTRELIARADTPMKQKITSLAQQCSEDAQALINLLEELRGPIRSKQWPVLQKMLRALKKKRKVEKLENALKSKEAQLNALLTQDTHANVESIKAHTSALQPSIARMDKRLGKVDKHLRSKQAADTASQQEKSFLASLSFPDMNARLDTIKEAHAGTVEWIFEQHEERAWHDFPRWLAQPTNSMYWICGKAASGKSTLMARLLNDVRTRQILKQWSKRKKLHLLSFFFWKPGSDLQRSIVGVLRSLLYQVCQKSEHLLRHVMNVNGSAGYHSWTQTRLVDTLKSVLARQSKVCFAIFIDGLDEYEGDCFELVNLLKTLQRNPTLKFCVSSRPEAQLTQVLRSCDSLRMQDYNLPDIHRYVTDKLGEYDPADGSVTRKEVQEIRDHIVSNASGMFLWAVLVVKTIIRGLRLGDDTVTIHQRLVQLPTEIHALLRQMLRDIDEVHKPNLHFYFRALMAWQGLQRGLYVTQLSITRWPECIETYEMLEDACDQIVKQIEKQSAGLLELNDDPRVHKTYYLGEDGEEVNSHEDCAKPGHTTDVAERRAAIAVPAMLHPEHAEYIRGDRQRKIILQATTLRKLINLSFLQLAWIHRSLYDVVRHEMEDLFGQALTSTLEQEDVLWSCLKGAVTAVFVVPVVLQRPQDLLINADQLEYYLAFARDGLAKPQKEEMAQLVWNMSPRMTVREITDKMHERREGPLPSKISRQAICSAVFLSLSFDSVFIEEQLSRDTMKDSMAAEGWLCLVLWYLFVLYGKFYGRSVGSETVIFAKLMELALGTGLSSNSSLLHSTSTAPDIFLDVSSLSCWDEEGSTYQTAKLDRSLSAISRLRVLQGCNEDVVRILYYLQWLHQYSFDLSTVHVKALMRRLFEIATACKLRFGLPYYDAYRATRMIVYASLNLSTIWEQEYAWCWPNELHPRTAASKPCLWLFCHPRRSDQEPQSRNPDVVVHVSADATVLLVEVMEAEDSRTQGFHSLRDRTEDILMLQIAKQDPPLSSTQQLLARACLRHSWSGFLAKWWSNRSWDIYV